MTDYIRTDDVNFNVKEELKKKKKIVKESRSFDNLGVGEAAKVREAYFADRKTDIEIKVDSRTGREYLWDNKYKREVSSLNPTRHQLYNKKGESLHDRIRNYYNEKNNIPSEADRNQALKDIRYLEARIRYDQREIFKNKEVTKVGYENGKRKVTKSTVHAENIRKDKEAGRLLNDGRTVYEAKWEGETNRFETDMVNSYENSGYKNKDFNSLNIKVQNKAKEEKKKKEVQAAYYTKPPKEKVNRYMNIAKEQYKLDETVNKNPMRDSIKVGPKDVGKTYSLDKLLGLQIEQ